MPVNLFKNARGVGGFFGDMNELMEKN